VSAVSAPKPFQGQRRIIRARKMRLSPAANQSLYTPNGIADFAELPDFEA
jgi:hypothetical protein